MKSAKVLNLEFTVDYEDYAESPREWDDLSVIYSNHKRYNPDGHSIEELLDEEGYLNMDGKVGLMVWMLEHGSCSFRTTEIANGHNPFSEYGYYATFDSGKFGVIAMTIEAAKKEWGEEWEQKAKDWMKHQVEMYGKWANGEIYSFSITKGGEFYDGCGNIYSEEEAYNDGLGEFKKLINNECEKIEKALNEGDVNEMKQVYVDYSEDKGAEELIDTILDGNGVKDFLRGKLQKYIEVLKEGVQG